jgi:Fe-S-cluster containining protein
MIPEANVPCNGCTACCRNELIVIVDEDGDPAQWETFELPMPEAAMVAKLGLQVPEGGVRCLAQKVDRSCIYLGPQGCTIYDRRPIMCRAFDCRKIMRSFGMVAAVQMIANGNEVARAGVARLPTLEDEDVG